MNIILELFLPASLLLIMFSLGISLTPANFLRVFTIPRAIILGLIGQLILLPAVAFLILANSHMPSAIAFSVMLLALSPGGVTSNILTKYAGGSVALSVSLTALSSVLCVFTLPVIAAAASHYFLRAEAPPINIARIGLIMALITVVPVAIGVALNTFWPAITARIEKIMSFVATVLFIVIVAGAIATNLPLVLPNLITLAPLLILLNVIMLVIGYWIAKIAKLSHMDSVAIALEIGIQNATLGITVGGLIAVSGDTFPVYSLGSAIYGITMYFCGFSFIFWNKMMKKAA